jgi:hypothetical protein
MFQEEADQKESKHNIPRVIFFSLAAGLLFLSSEGRCEDETFALDEAAATDEDAGPFDEAQSPDEPSISSATPPTAATATPDETQFPDKTCTPNEVWAEAQLLGTKHNLDPLLLFSIACAESSLDPKATNGQARGLMQLTPLAWRDATTRSFDDAWDWHANMEVSAEYLGQIRTELQRRRHYSWPVLAAAYHLGLGKVTKSGYDLDRLPPVHNHIYTQLFEGHTPYLPYPAPLRRISNSTPRQYQPDSEENIVLSIPSLDVDEPAPEEKAMVEIPEEDLYFEEFETLFRNIGAEDVYDPFVSPYQLMLPPELPESLLDNRPTRLEDIPGLIPDLGPVEPEQPASPADKATNESTPDMDAE